MMNLRTALSCACNSGSEKEGIHHWWMQRLTSIALTPLALWLGFSLACLPDLSYPTVSAWFKTPSVSILMFLFVIISCYHAALGLQVIIEDYVHLARLKQVSIISIQLVALVLAVTSGVAILKLFL